MELGWLESEVMIGGGQGRGGGKSGSGVEKAAENAAGGNIHMYR